MDKSYLNLVGLAYRAGKCTVGEENILKELRANKVKLLLIAKDCSAATKKRFIDKCNTFKVPYMEADNRETLAHAIGKNERVAVAINDKGFAKSIQNKLS